MGKDAGVVCNEGPWTACHPLHEMLQVRPGVVASLLSRCLVWVDGALLPGRLLELVAFHWGLACCQPHLSLDSGSRHPLALVPQTGSKSRSSPCPCPDEYLHGLEAAALEV